MELMLRVARYCGPFTSAAFRPVRHESDYVPLAWGLILYMMGTRLIANSFLIVMVSPTKINTTLKSFLASHAFIFARLRTGKSMRAS